MMRRLSFLLVGLAAATSSASLAGCGDTFTDPFLRDTGPLSVYGTVLSNGAPVTSRLRIQAIRTLPDPPVDPSDPAAQIPVEVITEVVETGATYRWELAQLRLPDGTLGTVVESTFRAWPGKTHRIRVRRTFDDVEATVTLDIPQVPTGTLGPATGTTQTISWDAENIVGGEVQYYVPSPQGPMPVRVPIEPQYGSLQTLDYARDLQRVRQILSESGDNRDDIVLLRARARPYAASEESWPILPPEDRAAAQGTFSNVEGGRGLVTAATIGQFDFLPDRDAARAAGFLISY